MRKAESVLRVGDTWMEIACSNGDVVRVALSECLEGGPLFRELADPARFRDVHVDELGALEWANGASLAPERLTELLDGAPVHS